MQVRRVLARFYSHCLAAALALLLLGVAAPLNLAGPTALMAADVNDLKKCAEAASNLVEAGGVVAETAIKIADAVADPTFVACTSAAAAGDVVTIGFMAAVSALYAAGTLGDMHNPEDCVAAIKSKVMNLIAETLNDMIEGKGELGGIIKPIIDALLPDFAVDLIKTIVSDASSDLAKQATEALWDALGIITSKIECGCAAAGTAAIIKDAYDALADKMAELKKNAASCVEILKDPIGFVKSVISNPGAALQAVGEVVCNGMKEIGVDACGAFVAAGGVILGFFEDAGEAIWSGVQAVGCAVFGWGCEDNSTPPPPPTCGTDPQSAAMASFACVCPPGMGLKTIQVQSNTCGSYGKFESLNYAEKLSCTSDTYTIDKKYCATCDKNSILNSFGSCQTCPAGLLPGPDGKCSKAVICNAAAGEFIGPDGHSCSTCPAGSKLGAGGKCNALPANCSAWPWLQAKTGPAPQTGIVLGDAAPQVLGLNTAGNGTDSWCGCPEGLINTGKACEKPKPAGNTSPCAYDWQVRDPATGVCKARCAPNEIYAYPATGDVQVQACRICPSGQISYQNTCTSACKSNEVRMVVYGAKGELQTGCFACPDGSKAGGTPNAIGEASACVNSCAPGSAWQTVQAMTGNISIGGIGNNAGAITFSACMPCAAGSYASVGKATINGAGIEIAACNACPKFKTSDEGATSCHDMGNVSFAAPKNASLRAPHRKLIDDGKPSRSRAAEDDDEDAKPKAKRPAPKQQRAAPEAKRAPAAAAPQRLVCGPGKVPNKAGTRCLIDLDEDDSPRVSGSGSSIPARRGGSGGAVPVIRGTPATRHHVD